MSNWDNFEKIDILLVDDRQENLLSLEAVLESPRYSLIKASSGDEALRYLLNNTPALILMDVQMPHLSGYETAAIIKGSDRTREIPIIFITAIGKDETLVHQGYDHGAVDYIYKPYDAHNLTAKVAVFADIKRQHGRVSRLVAVQQAVTQALADVSGVDEAIAKVLRSVCSSLEWDFGLFWRVNNQTHVLYCQSEWHEPARDAPEFIGASFKKHYGPGVGLPGRVWESQNVLWIAEIAVEKAFSRFVAAERESLKSVVALPVCVNGEVLGVIEFYSRKKLSEDNDLIKIMAAIGSQVGQVLKRIEALNFVRVSEARQSFLVEASATLSSSLNYEETFSTLASLAVKSLADWCTIDVAEEGAPPRALAIAHTDATKRDLTVNMRQNYPLDRDALIGAPNVIRTGKSEIYPDIPDEFLVKVARDQGHLKLLRELGTKSAMVVPLIARTKTLGAITLVSTQAGRRYSTDDLILAEELAWRAAVAIDNAKLYKDAQEAIITRDEFFSIASHELKTPITALKMMIQVTQRGVKPVESLAPSPEKLAKMLDTSAKQVDRLTRLVDDLLDVVKIRAGKLNFNFEELNLSELVQDILEQFAEAFVNAKCKLELNLEPNVKGIWDHNRIEQVMVNLISNAIKYAAGNPIVVKVTQDAEIARVVVQDFGPGIPHEQQLKIFDRFERAIVSRNINGLGLGLFIVKQIVEAHHGTIRVDSRVGMGSAFIVELPTKSVGAVLDIERNKNVPPIAHSAAEFRW